MKAGDYIYYVRYLPSKVFETIPARIMEVNNKTLRIRGNLPEGNRIMTVSKKHCSLQDLNE